VKLTTFKFELYLTFVDVK